MNTVDVRPELFRWARERGGLDIAVLKKRFPKLEAWERGEAKPSMAQLENFAKFTHAPIGFLFLPSPPVEAIPIPDFRRMSGERPQRPGADLLDVIYLCQQRQDWFRDYAQTSAEPRRVFVGSARLGDDPLAVAADIGARLGFDLEGRARLPSWTEALRRFIEEVDAIGVLVMVSGVVGSNTRRVLDPREFRGFALSDDLAPLVFVNGADSKAAQMFTLAHELAHLWLGQSALSDASLLESSSVEVERWCDRVAVELLVPMESFRNDYDPEADRGDEAARLARRYKVSSLVILRRMRDGGGLDREAFVRAYEEELGHLREVTRAGGGDFYRSLGARVGKTFARAVVLSTLEGRSSFTDAFRMLGFKKMSTFTELSRSLGLAF